MIKAVKGLVEGGFAVHFLLEKEKRPFEKNWSDAPVMSWEELERDYRKGWNLGVRLGGPSHLESGYLYIIDMDIRDEKCASEAKNALKKLFPGVKFFTLPTVKSGSGGSGRHFYFTYDEVLRSKKLANSGKKVSSERKRQQWTWEIELLGDGKQAVLPPSIHPDTGKKYIWLNKPDFDLGIPSISSDVIEELIREEEYDEDYDSDQRLGLSYEDAEEFLNDLPLDYWCEDREGWRNVGMALHHEFEGSDDAFDIWCEFSKNSKKFDLRVSKKQWESFGHWKHRPLRMATIMKAVRQERILRAFDEIEEIPEGRDGEDHTLPDMSIVGRARASHVPFPLNLLGTPLANEIRRQARNVSAPVDFVAGAILCGASAMIGNTVRVQIKPGYVQPAILWGQMIGPPSSNKSPALHIITSIIHKIESGYEPYFREAMRQWEAAKTVAERKFKIWDARLKEAVDAGATEYDTEVPKECIVPPLPPKRQFLLNDLTIEAFMRAQVRNPRGFMVNRDELAGWLGGMERYSAESERSAWLESYDGGSYAIERVKDEGNTVRVRALFSPVMGGIQPERLLDITANSVVDDGLQARFLPFWPEKNIFPMTDDSVDVTWLMTIFQTLSELTMDKDPDGVPIPRIKKMTKDAYKLFAAWSDNRKVREFNTPTRLAGAYGKAEGQVARLSLILEYIWWASVPDFEDVDPPKEIGVKAVECAIGLRERYFKKIQRRVFAHASESEEMANARLIAQWIIDEGIEETTTRAIRIEAGIKGINSHTRAEIVDEAVAILVSMRWLHIKKEKTKGRPSVRFIINPMVFELSEELI